MMLRLLMMMHVRVATVLNIGAVPHGIRRTALVAGVQVFLRLRSNAH